jgi:hypothetical protein
MEVKTAFIGKIQKIDRIQTAKLSAHTLVIMMNLHAENSANSTKIWIPLPSNWPSYNAMLALYLMEIKKKTQKLEL